MSSEASSLYQSSTSLRLTARTYPKSVPAWTVGTTPTSSGLRAVALSIGFSVEDSDELPENVNGDCNHELRRLRVRGANSPMQRVKTLAHELGHAILHTLGDGRPDSRPLMELEAESVAFIVCANNGINSDDYSFGYVANWAGGSDEARDAIKGSGGRIQRAAEQILSAMSEEALAEVS